MANRRVLPIVEARDLRKVFRTTKRMPGALGALRSLFTREYEERVAVGGVSFSLEPGELVGYIGPNGAGKSTTIKMLTGILVPTSGEVRVAGLVPWKSRKENARNIGVVFGQRSQLYWDLPLIESFELLRAIYGVPADRYRQNLDEFVEILEMEDFLRTPVRQLVAGPADARRFCGGTPARSAASSTWTSRRSGSTSWPSKRFASSSRGSTPSGKRRSSSRRTTSPTWSGSAGASCSSIDGTADLRRRHRSHQERVRPFSHARRAFLRAGRASRNSKGPSLPESKDSVARFRFDRNRQRADLLVRQASERYRVEDVSLEEPDLESIIRRIYVEGYEERPKEDAL